MFIREQTPRKLHFAKKTKCSVVGKVLLEDQVASESGPEKTHEEVEPSGKEEKKGKAF